MTRASTLRRLWRLRPRQVVLLTEAFLSLAATSAAIKFLPFRRVAASAERRPRLRIPRAWQEQEPLRQVLWAVERTAALVPWRTVCFQKGLTVHRMLCRRGASPALHYGVRRGAPGNVEAHVWVTVGGEAVIGGDEAAEFTCVATFAPPTHFRAW